MAAQALHLIQSRTPSSQTWVRCTFRQALSFGIQCQPSGSILALPAFDLPAWPAARLVGLRSVGNDAQLVLLG